MSDQLEEMSGDEIALGEFLENVGGMLGKNVLEPHACMYVCKYACIYVIYVCMHASMCVYLYASIHVCICMHLCIVYALVSQYIHVTI